MDSARLGLWGWGTLLGYFSPCKASLVDMLMASLPFLSQYQRFNSRTGSAGLETQLLAGGLAPTLNTPLTRWGISAHPCKAAGGRHGTPLGGGRRESRINVTSGSPSVRWKRLSRFSAPSRSRRVFGPMLDPEQLGHLGSRSGHRGVGFARDCDSPAPLLSVLDPSATAAPPLSSGLGRNMWTRPLESRT